jgi:hypothetical protein
VREDTRRANFAAIEPELGLAFERLRMGSRGHRDVWMPPSVVTSEPKVAEFFHASKSDGRGIRSSMPFGRRGGRIPRVFQAPCRQAHDIRQTQVHEDRQTHCCQALRSRSVSGYANEGRLGRLSRKRRPVKAPKPPRTPIDWAIIDNERLRSTTDFVRLCWLEECDIELAPHQKQYCTTQHGDRDRKRRQRARELDDREPRSLAQALFDDNALRTACLRLHKARRPILRQRVDQDRIFDRVHPGEGRFPGEERIEPREPSGWSLRPVIAADSTPDFIVRILTVEDAVERSNVA